MSTARNGAPLGAPAPVQHFVKFRNAGTNHLCDSEACPEHQAIITRGSKYARVIRTDHEGDEVLEFFHPKCYDYEFDQGAHHAR